MAELNTVFQAASQEMYLFLQTKNGHRFRDGRFSCGAGGDRTLVQTTATWAFYMRSHFIGFRPQLGKGTPPTT
jgi:hypothetical protein